MVSILHTSVPLLFMHTLIKHTTVGASQGNESHTEISLASATCDTSGIRMGACMCACVRPCVRAYKCMLCVCACVHVCMCACVHVCICACVHVCMCVCVVVHSFISVIPPIVHSLALSKGLITHSSIQAIHCTSRHTVIHSGGLQQTPLVTPTALPALGTSAGSVDMVTRCAIVAGTCTCAVCSVPARGALMAAAVNCDRRMMVSLYYYKKTVVRTERLENV